MGVCLVGYGVEDSTIGAVLAEPPLIWRVVEREDDSQYLEELRNWNKTSLWSWILGKRKPELTPKLIEFGPTENEILDVDKSWDGLDLCLRMCRPNAPSFFKGSGKMGSIEVGYGPALYHYSQSIDEIASAYLGISESEIIKAFTSADFKGVYLESVWEAQDDSARDYLMAHFSGLQTFLQHAQKHKLGAILQFT